jgi:hypothetical protein
MKYKFVLLFCIFSHSLWINNVSGQNQFRIDSLKAVISVENYKEKQIDDYNIIAGLF